jgi:PHP family Zn ribbon phosphoesterase
MKIFKADLHIHSCLSPCADLDMSPRAIVNMSLARGIDIIAVCDHNSAENVGAAMRAGAKRGLFVFPGMEICSREEVHTIALFETVKQAIKMQEIVYRRLTGTNRPEVFGDQVVVNEFDEVEGFNDRMLIGATQLALLDVVKDIRRLGGLSIASHVDRPSFSILGQLGFIPAGLDIDALEISRHIKKELAPELPPGARDFPIVTSSDAHFLDDIGIPCTSFLLESPSLDEIRMALKGKCGRRIEG